MRYWKTALHSRRSQGAIAGIQAFLTTEGVKLQRTIMPIVRVPEGVATDREQRARIIGEWLQTQARFLVCLCLNSSNSRLSPALVIAPLELYTAVVSSLC